MDPALENSPGPPKWMAGTPRPGYPVDPRILNQDNGYPAQHGMDKDAESGVDGAKDRNPDAFCCGCPERTAVSTAVVLLVLLLAAAGLAVGLGIGLNQPDRQPRQAVSGVPSPAGNSTLAPAPQSGTAAQPSCNTDQECFVQDQARGWWCVAGECVYQLPDAYYCNRTTGSRPCYSGVCGDISALGLAKQSQPNACLTTTGNRCRRSAACASQVCKDLGSGSARAQYCIPKSGVADQPPAKFVEGSPCKVDVNCGSDARCLQSECTLKADYGEVCSVPGDCFSGDCALDSVTNSSSCTIADGALCGTVDSCKASSYCSSDGYCVAGATTSATG